MIDIGTALSILRDAGVTGALLLAVYGGKMGWYLWKGQHEEIIKLLKEQQVEIVTLWKTRCTEIAKDRDWWRDVANKSTNFLDHSINLAEKQEELKK